VKVVENQFGPGKSWKLKLKVLESILENEDPEQLMNLVGVLNKQLEALSWHSVEQFFFRFLFSMNFVH